MVAEQMRSDDEIAKMFEKALVVGPAKVHIDSSLQDAV